jgi:hypothetical protein
MRDIARELRVLLTPWGFSLLLPAPLLFVEGENASSDLAILYVALGAAWLAIEAFRPEHAPKQRVGWNARCKALAICVAVNILAFSLIGWTTGIQSNIPWPLLTVLGVTPSLGLVPWLVLRLNEPYGALILGALVVGGTKIFGCIVARIAYGPDYIALGYVSADWQTAKLMISVMCSGTVLISGTSAWAVYRQVVAAREL